MSRDIGVECQYAPPAPVYGADPYCFLGPPTAAFIQTAQSSPSDSSGATPVCDNAQYRKYLASQNGTASDSELAWFQQQQLLIQHYRSAEIAATSLAIALVILFMLLPALQLARKSNEVRRARISLFDWRLIIISSIMASLLLSPFSLTLWCDLLADVDRHSLLSGLRASVCARWLRGDVSCAVHRLAVGGAAAACLVPTCAEAVRGMLAV